MAETESDQIDSREGFCYGNLEKALGREIRDLWKAVVPQAVELS